MLVVVLATTAQKMKSSIKDFLSKCDQIRSLNLSILPRFHKVFQPKEQNNDTYNKGVSGPRQTSMMEIFVKIVYD